ncbi:ABC-2 family transporter protein [Saccharibacillus sp. CPCC 101409]|uniref:ABC-2 family transporter protein n=1 Tax=Saccharibacillus sp. CPCC 101409 TaxID=3058041 RepID=UPI00267264AB|nr:ABC-2 family transporter protein [Saccharibacillus sp. CPCC 101409]MDO3408255.1 ABC-2 family transporter protein [Saccharibacillus sp. CPCC 101409]
MISFRSSTRLYFVLAAKGYARNIQYRGSHLLHNFASATFGYLYACIWIGLGRDYSLGEYGTLGMMQYITFTQMSLWVSSFMTNGLGIPQSVRTGQIALDLMRPVHLFAQLMAREWGQIAYQFFYKSVPIYLVMLLALGMLPAHGGRTLPLALLALAGAAYLSICINYLIGVSSLWTTESSWLYWGNQALMNLLAGFFIPIQWLPLWLQQIAWASPYPFMLYVPTQLYLGKANPVLLLGTLAWGLALTGLCLLATRVVRRRVEVQGG